MHGERLHLAGPADREHHVALGAVALAEGLLSDAPQIDKRVVLLSDRADGHADATTRPAAARKPVSFDFKLRLTSPDDGPPSAPQEVGIELEPLDLAAITGVQPDTPRAYQTDGDLQSLIVELANQIADPNTASTPVVRVTASATIEKSRSSSRAAEAAPAGHRGESPSEPVTVPAARAASPVMPSGSAAQLRQR